MCTCSTSAWGLVSTALCFGWRLPLNPFSCLKMRAINEKICLHTTPSQLGEQKNLKKQMLQMSISLPHIQNNCHQVNSLSLQAGEPCLIYQAVSKLPNWEYTQEMCATWLNDRSHLYYCSCDHKSLLFPERAATAKVPGLQKLHLVSEHTRKNSACFVHSLLPWTHHPLASLLLRHGGLWCEISCSISW